MNKPIGYFLSNSSDAQTLQQITSTYGDRLEALDRGQKIHTLLSIAQTIYLRHGFTEVPEDLFDWVSDEGGLSDDALLGLVSAIAGQLREVK